MALHVFAIGKNVRPMRAHPRISPRASVLRSPAGFAEIAETMPVCELCSARDITRDRRPAPSADSLAIATHVADGRPPSIPRGTGAHGVFAVRDIHGARVAEDLGVQLLSAVCFIRLHSSSTS